MPSPIHNAPLRLSSDWSPLRAWQVVALLGVFAFGLLLRWDGGEQYPPLGTALEELQNLQSGVFLLQNNRGEDLPHWAAARKWIGFRRSDSVFDQPPLVPVMVGAYAWFRGARPTTASDDVDKPPAAWAREVGRARPLMLLWFSLTFLLLFDLSRRAFSAEVGLLAVVLYAIFMHIVFQNRLLVAENVTTPLFLLNLCLLQRLEAGRCGRWIFGGGTVVTVAAAMLCRVSAVGHAAAILYLLFVCGRRREAVYPIVGAVVGLFGYALYSWWQGWSVQAAFSAAHWTSSGNYLALLDLVAKPFQFSSISVCYPLFVSWLVLFALVFRSRKQAILMAPLIYLLCFVFFRSLSDETSWVALPFFPFLCLALAVFLREAWIRATPVSFAAFLCLLLPNFLNTLYLEHTDHRFLLRQCYLVAVPALLFLPFLRARVEPAFRQGFIVAVVALALIAEFWAIWTYGW